jgi:tetratricopeptide (TPR) repeat protein
MASSVTEAIRLLRSGRLADAEALARALLAEHRDADALHVLGCIRAQAGAREEALALLDEAISLKPRDASFLNNRGGVLAQAGRLEEAIRDLRRAVQLEPAFSAAFLQLGQVLLRSGDAAQAVVALRKATVLAPRDFNAHFLVGLAEMDRSRPVEAEPAFRAALALAPGDATSHNNLGVALQRQGRAAEAIEQFRAALASDPSLAAAHVNWGNALENLGDLEAARGHYREAATLAPGSPDAWLNGASNAVELGALDEARAGYLRALELAPQSGDARYGLGILDLREQRFAQGWAGFEGRFGTHPPQSVHRGPPLPAFTRSGGKSQRVAVWLEQGVGDQILFSTILPELREDATPVAEVDARLIGAYRRGVDGVQFVSTEESRAAFATCTAQIAVGSLPSIYRTERSSFARQPTRLLRADPERVASMRAHLGEGRFIAISWKSVQKGLRVGLAARKSIPLELFARLARARNACLLDVQYGDAAQERADFEAAHPGVLARIPGLDAFSDLEGVLAAIEACGEVVTASNVTAHLAGASGVPATVVMLGARSPFHYWDAVEGTHSLWYPTLRVASDPRWKRWEDALDSLSAS